MMENSIVNVYATAAYIEGYVSVAHPDDEHLNEWAERLLQTIELAMEEMEDGDA